MPLGGNGRIPLNIKFHKETIHKFELVNSQWKENWGWAIPHFLQLQKDLAETNLPKADRKIRDKRTLKPVPVTANNMYGWVATNPKFRLEIYGPDVMGYPLDIPKCDDIDF